MINLRYEIIRQLGKGRSTVFVCKDIEMSCIEHEEILVSRVDHVDTTIKPLIKGENE